MYSVLQMRKWAGDHSHSGHVQLSYHWSSLTILLEFFFCAHFQPCFFFLHTCHLKIELCTCDSGGQAIPKGLDGSQLRLLLTYIFTFKVLPSCFVWTLSSTLGLRVQHRSDIPTCHCGPALFIITAVPSVCPAWIMACRTKPEITWTKMLFKRSLQWLFLKFR